VKIINRLSGLAVFIALSAGMAHCQEYHTSLDMRVPFIPGALSISGRHTVTYELYLTNFSTDYLCINRLKIFDAKDSSVLRTMNKDEITERLAPLAFSQNDLQNILPPGKTAILYLDLTLSGKKVTRLFHSIDLEVADTGNKKTFPVTGAPIQLDKHAPVVVGSPVDGGPWAAVYNPSWQRGHRRVVYTVDGQARIPGRYAIDFIKLDSLGRFADGDNDIIKNWYGYGASVIAVANGTVLAARDNFTESPTLSGHPACPPENATGNYIALEIGDNHIAFYEHLQPGSIRVKAGQRVKKGEVIASIGFTGQTTGPHLHFHVANQASPLGAEGIPFVFEQFTILGSYPDFSKFGKVPWIPAGATRLTQQRPAPQSVLTFSTLRKN